MCEPITMGVIAAASTALQVGGSILGAVDQQKSLEFEALALDQNADYAKAASSDAKARGEVDAARYRTAGTKVVSAQKVGAAASGVDSSSGSVSELMADSRLMSELDAQTTKNNAAREAFGYDVQENNFRTQAQFTREKAKGVIAGALLGGAGSALSGFAKAYAIGKGG